MGLFDKKYCDICGEKISLLGNRKLEDGNMCSSCAKLISPHMTDRRQTSVSETKEHLTYRELNRQKLASFNISQTFGDGEKVYIDSVNRNFIVSYSSPTSWDKENPDVIPLTEVVSCNLDIKENRTEEYTKDAQGNRKSYVPPRYKYDYNFYIIITLSSRWFNEIKIKLNTFDVEGLNSQKYHNYDVAAQQLIGALSGNQVNFSYGTGYGVGAQFGSAQPGGVIGGLATAFVNQVEQNAYNAGIQQNAAYTDAVQNDLQQQREEVAKLQADELLKKTQEAVLEALQTKGCPNSASKCPTCGTVGSSKFCPSCGSAMAAMLKVTCQSCGYDFDISKPISKFCPACGHRVDINDIKQ